MSEIRKWLDAIGLVQYADAFEANDIDGATLHGLTAEDLRELGIASLGHRKRIMQAISRLDGIPEQASGSPARPIASSSTSMIRIAPSLGARCRRSAVVYSECVRGRICS